MKNYTSVIYDLSPFGVYKISNAIVCCDADDDIVFEISFDGGKSFVAINSLNNKFPVLNSNGKVQVKIYFPEPNPKADIYKVKSTGFFQQLEIGTTIYFKKKSTNEVFTTNIGDNGRYNISLPRGKYSVSYLNNNKNTILLDSFNPEVAISNSWRMDKDAIVEGIFRDIPWAKYCVFDTFVDSNKMLSGTAIIDPDGNLSDGETNRKVKYWIIGFN